MSGHDGLWWALLALGTAPAWATLVWFLNELYIRPLLLPKEDIERLADELRRSHPTDPAGAALDEELNAWYRSDTFEQGKWRRVKRFLDRN
jgi:hypothetical protein